MRENLKKYCLLVLFILLILTGNSNKISDQDQLYLNRLPEHQGIDSGQNTSYLDLPQNIAQKNIPEDSDILPVKAINDFAIIHNNQGIPVLMYHSVAGGEHNKLILPVEKFREQMQYLKEHGYTTLSLGEFYSFLKDNTPVPKKSVLITLDDGYEDNYTNAFPILNELGLKATVFVTTGTIDRIPGKLSSTQIKTMSENGIDFGSHAVYHEDFSTLSYDTQSMLLQESQSKLENIIGKEIIAFAYPSGKYNKSTGKALENNGYRLAFTVESGLADKTDGLFKLDRIRVYSTDTLDDFKQYLTFYQ